MWINKEANVIIIMWKKIHTELY